MQKDLKSYDFRSFLVEISGIEPLTSWMPFKRSPSWAIPPYFWPSLDRLIIITACPPFVNHKIFFYRHPPAGTARHVLYPSKGCVTTSTEFSNPLVTYPQAASLLSVPYRRKSQFYSFFMVSFIRNFQAKLKPISMHRYLCMVPKHACDIRQCKSGTVFKYQLRDIPVRI